MLLYCTMDVLELYVHAVLIISKINVWFYQIAKIRNSRNLEEFFLPCFRKVEVGNGENPALYPCQVLLL